MRGKEIQAGKKTLQSHLAFHLACATGVEWNDAAAQSWLRRPGRLLLHEAACITAGGGRISPVPLALKREKRRSRETKRI